MTKKHHYQISIELGGWEEGDDPEKMLNELIGVFCNRAKSSKWLKSVMKASLTAEGQGYVAWHNGKRVVSS